MTKKDQIHQLLSRGVEEVIIKKDLEKELNSGKKLRIKLGIDPTGSELHLGHSVVLRKLKQFQELGHKVIFLIGDFTARIGDPTGRSETRPSLTDKQIKANMKDYVEQASLILNIKEVEIRYNSEWLGKMSLENLVILASKATYAQVAQRADFKKRIQEDVDLSLQEFLYPIMQGYDSVALKADVEIGGTDQKFNLLMGRQIQKRYKQKEQNILTVPLLEGLDGQHKMSKSLDNYIGLSEKPEKMYGKIMSLPDELIVRYFELCTDVSMDEVNDMSYKIKHDEVNPRDVKMQLAREIVKIYHDKKGALEAEEHFRKVFQKHETPDEIKTFKYEFSKAKVYELFVESGLCSSNGEAKRLAKQGGLSIDSEVVTDIQKEIKIPEVGLLLKRGKRQFVRVIKR